MNKQGIETSRNPAFSRSKNTILANLKSCWVREAKGPRSTHRMGIEIIANSDCCEARISSVSHFSKHLLNIMQKGAECDCNAVMPSLGTQSTLQIPETVPGGIPSASQVPFYDSDAVSLQLYSHKASFCLVWCGSFEIDLNSSALCLDSTAHRTPQPCLKQ